jgi:orotidine-5'-phosphate decarboxylase
MEDRLIVALDVPSIAEARRLVDTLDGVVSFFSAIGSSSALALTGFSII